PVSGTILFKRSGRLQFSRSSYYIITQIGIDLRNYEAIQSVKASLRMKRRVASRLVAKLIWVK
ncbi:hypothetical protein ACC684_39320, partial [Rhizobium ruizarguesonis]